MRIARELRRLFGSKTPLGLLIVAVTLVLLSACLTESGAAGDAPVVSSDQRPDVPPTESEPTTTPLRYPRLLDDPESDPAPGPDGVPVLAGVQQSPRLLATDPLIEDLLASLSLRQRIGQRFIVHVPGSSITYGAGRSIAEVAPAGFIIYPWNFETAEDVTRLTSSLQWFASSVTPGINLLLCADQEGGRVATFRFSDSVRVPSARTMGSLGPGPTEAAAYLTGTQLLNLGLNMNLAPVLDIYDGDGSTIIGDRSYSGDPAVVADLARAYLSGGARSGIISVAKHFPGHGITAVDSHSSLPVVTATIDELRSRDLVPFVTAIDSGIDVIMTAHILFESIDPFYPVTLSRLFLTDLLRGELGFDGVVMSDGLEMGALRDNFDLTEILIRLFRNDVDLLLLFVNYDVVELVDQVEELIRIGELTEDDIDRGVRRVLRLKLENGLAHPEDL